MTEAEGRKLLVDTGKELLENGLVVRTWGNMSCRLDNRRMLITPSGMDYTKTTEEDIVVYDFVSKESFGKRAPSVERGLHAAAYELYPDVNFVVHTHQVYATALGLYGWDQIRNRNGGYLILGTPNRAEYALPGSEELRYNVMMAMDGGTKVVYMKHHGAYICGRSKDEALLKALFLENVCKAAFVGCEALKPMAKAEKIREKVMKKYPDAAYTVTPELLTWAKRRRTIIAQLDDMAQMIGRKLITVGPSAAAVKYALRKHNAVIVRGVGAFVRGVDDGDRTALCSLTEKAAICALQTEKHLNGTRLSREDDEFMYDLYRNEYSLKKSAGEKEKK